MHDAGNDNSKHRLAMEQALTLAHRYALVFRPAGIGCIPKGLRYEVEPRPQSGSAHHGMARHGILVTDRELTSDEAKRFELAPLVDGAAIDFAATRVVAQMSDYAAEYLQCLEEDRAAFADSVLSRARIEDGVTFSIGDPEALVAKVIDGLRVRAGILAS